MQEPASAKKRYSEKRSGFQPITSYKEAVAAIGYSDDYEKYTICQSIGACFQVASVSPIVVINVLDPAKHKKNLDETTVQVNNGVAILEKEDVLLDKLVVKAETNTLAVGTDYTAAFDDSSDNCKK